MTEIADEVRPPVERPTDSAFLESRAEQAAAARRAAEERVRKEEAARRAAEEEIERLRARLGERDPGDD